MGIVEGKVILVTGAASGIGRATAIRLAKEGAKVAAADINEAGVKETADMIGGTALTLKVDISKSAEVEAMVKKVVEAYGRLDCAVNNAGTDAKLGVTIEQTDEATFDRVFSINVRGTWLCMKYELIQMHKQGSGVIVNVSSALGVRAVPGFSSYVSTKFAIVGLTKSAALENAKRGILINAMCPAAVRTPMLDRTEGVDWDAAQPMGRTGTVDEVAAGVLWLCSDESSFCTGIELLLDGGWTAGGAPA
jgi:NAD(P)-dependent dehydrogenase (short-subunit alcohol dehydrogenase family)